LATSKLDGKLEIERSTIGVADSQSRERR